MSTFFELSARALLGNNKLLNLEKVISWESLRPLVERSRGAGGQVPYDEICMLKALILQSWHNLSDPELEQALTTRLDFILFCEFHNKDLGVPDETTFCRYRNLLSSKGVLKNVLKSINAELESKGIKLKESRGALIDATIIDSAGRPNKSIENTYDSIKINHSKDPDATYTIKRSMPRLGYKCFARCDQEGFIENTNTLPANQAEISNLEPLLEGMSEGQRCCADKGFDSRNNRVLLKKYNLKDGIQRKDKPNKTYRRNTYRNKLISKTRFKIEQVFGTIKRKFKFTRATYFTTQKVQAQFTLKAVCNNLLKAINKVEISSSPNLVPG